MKPAAIFLLAIFAGTNAASAAASGLLDPAYRVVISADDVRFFLQPGCSALPEGIAEKVSGAWNPDKAVIAIADLHLPVALNKAVRETPWIGPVSRAREIDWEVIANHTRQYAGVVMQGRKLILVVAAPIYIFDFDGRHDLVLPEELHTRFRARGACDGGSHQFSAFYDSDKDSYSDFTFSGTIVGYSEP